MHVNSEHGTRTIAPPRRLTSREQEILDELVRHVGDDDERRALVCQAEHALVIEECLVGCGSIVLSAEEGACPPAGNILGAPVTGEGTWENAKLEVLLHVANGHLRMIQVYRPDGEATHGLLPAAVLTYY